MGFLATILRLLSNSRKMIMLISFILFRGNNMFGGHLQIRLVSDIRRVSTVLCHLQHIWTGHDRSELGSVYLFTFTLWAFSLLQVRIWTFTFWNGNLSSPSVDSGSYKFYPCVCICLSGWLSGCLSLYVFVCLSVPLLRLISRLPWVGF